MDKKELGQKMKEARINKKLSQIDCAKNCGVSVVAYQYWERGLCMPKKDNLERVCGFLEIE